MTSEGDRKLTCVFDLSSMLTFMLALIYVFFAKTSTVVRVFMSILLFFMGAIAGMLLYLDWERNEDSPESTMIYWLCPKPLRRVILRLKGRKLPGLKIKFDISHLRVGRAATTPSADQAV